MPLPIAFSVDTLTPAFVFAIPFLAASPVSVPASVAFDIAPGLASSIPSIMLSGTSSPLSFAANIASA